LLGHYWLSGAGPETQKLAQDGSRCVGVPNWGILKIRQKVKVCGQAGSIMPSAKYDTFCKTQFAWLKDFPAYVKCRACNKIETGDMNHLFRHGMIAFAALVAVAIGFATPAQAWWRGGVFVGVAPLPFFVGPPVVYPYYPPPYYAPPYYAPGVTYSPIPGNVSPGSSGRSCYAASYVCPLDQNIAPGGACSCPSNTGGRIGGRAG
jgi:hypothetical protein